ncbi:hypothetical protein GCM10027276_27850 [Comamonas piscis]
MSDRPSPSLLSRLWHTLFRIPQQQPKPAQAATGGPAKAPKASEQDDNPDSYLSVLTEFPGMHKSPWSTDADGQDSVLNPVADEAYRKRCAQHLYDRYPERIYTGMLPPMLYAIGVLDLLLDEDGHIQDMNWMREPAQAQEVPPLIEALVQAAAPFPAPQHLRHGEVMVSYTETWLWDASGQFQLHTLSEGQQ